MFGHPEGLAGRGRWPCLRPRLAGQHFIDEVRDAFLRIAATADGAGGLIAARGRHCAGSCNSSLGQPLEQQRSQEFGQGLGGGDSIRFNCEQFLKLRVGEGGGATKPFEQVRPFDGFESIGLCGSPLRAKQTNPPVQGGNFGAPWSGAGRE
jgi:hypothetical protein